MNQSKQAQPVCQKSHAIAMVAWKMRDVIAIPKRCECGAEMYPISCERCGYPTENPQPHHCVPAAPEHSQVAHPELIEVLRRHVTSSESMREAYQRVGTEKEEAYQLGVTHGLERAIEVCGNFLARQAPEHSIEPPATPVTPPTQTESESEWKKAMRFAEDHLRAYDEDGCSCELHAILTASLAKAREEARAEAIGWVEALAVRWDKLADEIDDGTHVTACSLRACDFRSRAAELRALRLTAPGRSGE
jgi:hypothetical protein